MKEKRELVEQDLKYDKFYIDDMNYLIEFSYIIGKVCKEQMAEFDKLLEFCTDGVELYSLFVIFCYKEYCLYYDDYVTFLEEKTEELITKFKEKYFEEE